MYALVTHGQQLYSTYLQMMKQSIRFPNNDG